jgi:Sulfotransferase domain
MGSAKMSIQVIGAGFGRTGTDSMREALTILGFGPCHHMFEVNANAEQRQLWRALALGAAPNWDRLLADYSSCVDWP